MKAAYAAFRQYGMPGRLQRSGINYIYLEHSQKTVPRYYPIKSRPMSDPLSGLR